MSTITHKSLTYRILVYLSNIGLNTTVSSTYKQDELCMLLSGTQKWFGDTHVCMHVSIACMCMHTLSPQETRCTSLKLFVTMGLFTCALLASLGFARTVQKIQIEINR